MGRDILHYTRLPRALSSLTLNAPRDGASTASLSNLFQCFTTLVIKNSSLTTSLDPPSLYLKPTGPWLSSTEDPKWDAVVKVESHQSGEYRDRTTSLDLLPMVFWMQPGVLSKLQVHTASSCPNLHPPASPSSSPQGFPQSIHPPTCKDTRGCPKAGTGHCT